MTGEGAPNMPAGGPVRLPGQGQWSGTALLRSGPANGTTTVGVYKPSAATLYLRNSNTTGKADVTVSYGNPGWVPVTGDWDGNGTTTVGAYNPKTATFYLRNSNTTGKADVTVSYGDAGWVPVVGDWDGK